MGSEGGGRTAPGGGTWSGLAMQQRQRSAGDQAPLPAEGPKKAGSESSGGFRLQGQAAKRAGGRTDSGAPPPTIKTSKMCCPVPSAVRGCTHSRPGHAMMASSCFTCCGVFGGRAREVRMQGWEAQAVGSRAGGAAPAQGGSGSRKGAGQRRDLDNSRLIAHDNTVCSGSRPRVCLLGQLGHTLACWVWAASPAQAWILSPQSPIPTRCAGAAKRAVGRREALAGAHFAALLSPATVCLDVTRCGCIAQAAKARSWHLGAPAAAQLAVGYVQWAAAPLPYSQCSSWSTPRAIGTD